MKSGDLVILNKRIRDKNNPEPDVLFYSSPGIWSTRLESAARFHYDHIGTIVEIMNVNKYDPPELDGIWAKIVCPTGIGWLPLVYIKRLS